MRTAGREDLDRHWSEPTTGHKPARPPISVVVGVVSLVAGMLWIDALEPAIHPNLTLEFQSVGWLLFSVAMIVGTLFGVRVAWVITLISTAAPMAIVLATAIQNPSTQTMGGSLLLTVALLFLLSPATRLFEHRRMRLVLD